MKIAIAGYGVEGEENYRYWLAQAGNELTIVDEHGERIPAGVASIVGVGAFEKLQGFDMVIRTAGLAPRKISTNGKIWSATNEFFEKCPAPIIGVTGSKGKGTTASLIASILEAAGRKVWLVGNIGLPGLSVLSQIQPEDIVVYELSSFQLWDLESAPHTAVVLFIEQEHLDVHADMNEYVEAKLHITRHQTANDILIFNARNPYATHIAENSQAQKIGYPSNETTHVSDGWFYNGQHKLCPVETLSIPGAHNIDNAIAAIDAIWEHTQNPEHIATGLRTFKGLPHRLAFVRSVNGVAYYDDSIATTPGSAIAALRAFGDKQKVIILGGSSKGSDFSELAVELTRHDAQAILIGAEAATIANALQRAGFTKYEILETTPQEGAEAFGDETIAQLAVRKATEKAQPGATVLLSPASASFGLFKNYVDRGEQFIAAVNAL